MEYVDSVTEQVVPLFHSQRQMWRDHFQWQDEGARIFGLTETGRATVLALKMNRPQMIRVRRMWIKLDEHPPKHFK
ncbi:MAG TPA: hypothetical protein VLL52_02225 [Anaerolineae bacterium]|nr:hypothetical protein [Anaerolineae bacterium]